MTTAKKARGGPLPALKRFVHSKHMVTLVWILGIVAVWEIFACIVAATKRTPVNVLPHLYEIIGSFFSDKKVTGKMTMIELIGTACGETLSRAGIGFLAGIAAGCILALLMNLSRVVEKIAFPYLMIIQMIPILGMAPIILSITGDINSARIVIAAILTFYPVSTNVLFMVYDFGVKDGVFYQLLAKSKEFGALIAVHAENNELVNTLTGKYISEGKTDAWYHYMSRPEFVEGEADERAINLAKAANAPLYIVHLANKQGVEAVTKAKDEGYEIYAETCPQYLEFTSDVYKRADGRNFVCSPPMKGQESQDAIWEAIKRGDIDTIATDHCPFQQSEKDWGLNDFRKIPNGCAGIENMYPYMLGKANDGVISFEKAVELCSANPAKIFGCTDKGEIAPGKDADIVIYDPAKEFTIHQENMHSDCDHTIWEGVKVHGYPVQTYSRGRLVFDNGEFVGERGWGRFVKCAKHKAK